jgi:hypothetical protein
LAGLFKWNARKDQEPVSDATPALTTPSESSTATKVFPKFIAALTSQPAPVLIDLGPVVGSNISFFGDRLSCKIYVEDLFSEVEQHAKRGQRDTLGTTLVARLTQPDDSVDGILCWDLFDFLDKISGPLLARKLTTLLRKGGALYGQFGSSPGELQQYSRFIIDADDRLRVRNSPATPVARNVLTTRDIIKMFDGLNVTESILLKSNTRETLFRKP